MIHGYFDASGHPTIKIVVGGIRMQVEIEALIDTGFDGKVSIPSIIATQLGLELISLEWVELADGSIISSLIFKGQALLGGQTREVEMMLTDADEALIGTGLLANYRLEIDFVNRTIEIQEIQPKSTD